MLGSVGTEPKKKKILNLGFQCAKTLLHFATPMIILSLVGFVAFFARPDSTTHHRLGIRSLHDDTSDDGKIHFINQHDHSKSLQSADHVVHSRDQFQTQVSSHGSEKQCRDPKKNIFFLKTHKAGSTTVQNVLLRYGERNNLTFALPKQPAAHVFNYNIKFNPSMVRPSPTGQYNILCNHLHFNEQGVQEVMPVDTKYIAIVRHPVDLFESIMSYYAKDVRAFQRIPGNNTRTKMKTFLDNPNKYYGYNMSHYERFGRNAMMYDFGFDNSEEDESVIQGWINYLEKTFDLVMITDYFDESMVLMKDELCWSTEDISYLKSNSRSKNIESIQSWLGDEYVDKLLQWNKADWMLYQHFNNTFTKKLEIFGEDRMRREVAELQKSNRKLTKDCLSEDQATRTVFKSVELTKYKLKDSSDAKCKDLIRTERQYLYQINKRQEDLLSRQRPEAQI